MPERVSPLNRPCVLLITDFRDLIPQRIHNWDGYDLGAIKRTLEAGGADVHTIGAHAVPLKDDWSSIRCAALYASSQASLYKQYLQGIVANLHFAGVQLYPALEHMMAHDDKAFQALRLQRTDVPAPRSWVFGDRDHAHEFLRNAAYPLVGKTPDGYGSRGVQLIRNKKEGHAFVARNTKHRVLRKGRPLSKRVWQRLCPPAPVLGLMLFQELIPHLGGDWKVLIWGNTACGLYRKNRPHDFRASGSGLVEFIDLPDAVLDFAHVVLRKLNLHWGSLDIAYDGGQCILLEYQAMHFGLTAADKGKFYYTRNADGRWEKREGRIEIEVEMSQLILRDLGHRGRSANIPAGELAGVAL